MKNIKIYMLLAATMLMVAACGSDDDDLGGNLRQFYMAILYKNSEGYKALAFWALNENVDRSKDDLKKYVISIDKLEELTGIDFFCNLPDDVENKVEAATYTQSWKW